MKAAHALAPLLLLAAAATDKQIAQTADVWAFEGYNLGLRKLPSGYRQGR
jgi:hypothetical protein